MAVTVLATLHIADLARDPKMRLPTRSDWRKIPRILTGEWPQPTPPYTLATTAADVSTWFQAALSAPYVVIDTEYNPKERWCWLAGLGTPDKRGLLVPRDQRKAWAEFSSSLAEFVRRVPVVMHNAAADIPILTCNTGTLYRHYVQIDDTMLAHAVLWSELPHDLGFLASLYGQHAKMKHLRDTDPHLYCWGDVLATIDVWEALREELAADPASARVYREQSLGLLPHVLRAEAYGIRANAARVRSAYAETQAVREAATQLAHAYCGWPINVGSDDQVARELYDVEGLPVQKHKDTKRRTINADAVATLRGKIEPKPDVDTEADEGLTVEAAFARVDAGAHPLLEARVLYSDAQQIESHYLRPAMAALETQDGRVYPHIMIHTQETGRWSITDPHARDDDAPYGLPMQQLPRDLRDIVMPDPGEAWIAWDWSGIEEVLLAALSGETTILDAYQNGTDLHARQAEAIFGEKARGREDYRTFTKRFKYRLYYLGEPRSAANIPGARSLGLDGTRLVSLSQRLLSTMPRLAAYRDRVVAQLTREPRIRTFAGRLRVALGSRGASAVRELWNHQFQGGVADILNTTIVAICERLPEVRLVYTAHDAGTLACRRERVDDVLPVVKEIVTRPIRVGGRDVSFPAKFHTVLPPKEAS